MMKAQRLRQEIWRRTLIPTKLELVAETQRIEMLSLWVQWNDCAAAIDTKASTLTRIYRYSKGACDHGLVSIENQIERQCSQEDVGLNTKLDDAIDVRIPTQQWCGLGPGQPRDPRVRVTSSNRREQCRRPKNITHRIEVYQQDIRTRLGEVLTALTGTAKLTRPIAREVTAICSVRVHTHDRYNVTSHEANVGANGTETGYSLAPTQEPLCCPPYSLQL